MIPRRKTPVKAEKTRKFVNRMKIPRVFVALCGEIVYNIF